MYRPGRLATFAILLPLASQDARAQEDVERRIRTDEFLAERQPLKPRPATASNKPVGPALVGVTVWRLRTPRTGDGARLIVHEDTPEAQELTPERLSTGSPLRTGDRIRISLECARGGYLYVLSRELYKGGSAGKPYLIFPSRRIMNGGNQVRPGRVVEIPEWSNATPYLRLIRSRPDQESEELIVFVTPAPIKDLMSDGKPMPVAESLLAEWQKKYTQAVRILDAKELAGAGMSDSEKAASTKGAILRPSDPPPQTIYATRAAPGIPIVIAFPLTIE